MGFLFCKYHGEKRQQTICDPQSLKYLLSGPLQKKFATPFLEPQLHSGFTAVFPIPGNSPLFLLGKLPLQPAPLFPDAWDYLVPTISGQLTVRAKLIP